jgi:signal transduction histidine kinase
VKALSLRTRLTAIYGTLFLITGGVLLGLMYLQTTRAMDSKFGVQISNVNGTYTSTDGVSPPPELGIIQFKGEVDRAIAQQKRDVLNQLLQSSLLSMFALALLAIMLGYFVAGRTLRPLAKVTATARRLSESTLHQRIAMDGPPDEIKELADTFDAMLDRLHHSFDLQRRFVANASHELRTPLTINRAVLEVSLASRHTPEETKVLARTLLGTTERHERLIEGLLLLARSERALDTRTDVDIPDLVRAVLDQLDPRDITITTALEPFGVRGDPVLLERCVFNLLENAIKYNVPHGRVHIRTDGNGLRVDNTGPQIAAHEIDQLFEPFRRLRSDRVGSAHGAGLGLSIVRAIATAHSLTSTATPNPDGGLTITLR